MEVIFADLLVVLLAILFLFSRENPNGCHSTRERRIGALLFGLIATALGIHRFNNAEGNPLMAFLVHQHWLLFVLVKGVLTPLLIIRLYQLRSDSPDSA